MTEALWPSPISSLRSLVKQIEGDRGHNMEPHLRRRWTTKSISNTIRFSNDFSNSNEALKRIENLFFSAFKFKFHLMISGDVSLLFLTSVLIIQNIRSRVFPSRLILQSEKTFKEKSL